MITTFNFSLSTKQFASDKKSGSGINREIERYLLWLMTEC